MLILSFVLACNQKNNRIEEYSEAYCTLYEECETLELMGFSDYQNCLEQKSETGDIVAEDKEAWEDCIAALWSVSCEDLYVSTTITECDSAE